MDFHGSELSTQTRANDYQSELKIALSGPFFLTFQFSHSFL